VATDSDQDLNDLTLMRHSLLCALRHRIDPLSQRPLLEATQIDTAISLVRARRYNEAYPILTKVQHSANPMVPFSLGVIEYERRNLGTARERLSAALSKSPSDAVVHANVHYYAGLTARDLGDSASALRHFREVLRLAPQFKLAAREVNKITSASASKSTAKTSMSESQSPAARAPQTEGPATATSHKAQAQVVTDLFVPETDAALHQFLDQKRKKEQGEWWIDNWSGRPWFMRLWTLIGVLLHVIFLTAFLIGAGYVILNMLNK
jgi:tetratricopeptide (TPR) repeat protein